MNLIHFLLFSLIENYGAIASGLSTCYHIGLFLSVAVVLVGFGPFFFPVFRRAPGRVA